AGDWRDNSYVTVTEFPEIATDTVILDVAHADLTGLAGVDQDDVKIRFKANDGAVDSPFAESTAFSVDLLAPTATLSGTPATTTNATSATITVGGEDAVSYQFSLDGGAFSSVTPVATPLAISGLVDGVHTVRVIATDDEGNVQAEADATTFTWTVDTTAGTALLTSKPDVRTNQTSATFVIGGEDVATYTYQLDGGEAQGPFSVDETIALTDLVEGPHTIAVTGIDALDNTQEEPTTYNWVIDTSAAAPTISGAPDELTNQTSATLTIGGDDVVAYRFALDGGAFGDETPVATPIVLTNLVDGVHTVAVIGRDAVGNLQAEANATSVTWTVDTIAPSLAEVTPVATPTNDPTPQLAIQVENGAAWEVLRGETVLASGTGTGVAQTVTLATLTDGIYTLTLASTDAAGNRGTLALEEFVVDTVSPTGASLSGVPSNPTNTTSATITVVAGADVVAYRFSFDGSAFGDEAPLATPITLSNLTEGAHTLKVIVKDRAGNLMPEGIAVTATWMVDTTPPIATLTGVRRSPTPATTANITVGGTDVMAYRHASDGGTFGAETTVETAIAFTNLSDGEHTLRVIGRDAAGNWQLEANATSATWTVDRSIAAPPTATPASGTFATTQEMTIRAPEAVIHYAFGTDAVLTCATGSTFAESGSVTIDATTTITAIACYDGDVPSLAATFTYTINRGGGGGGGGGGTGNSSTSLFTSPFAPAPTPERAALSVTPSVTPTGTPSVTPQVLGEKVFSDGVILRVNRRDMYLLEGGVRRKINDLATLTRFHHRERFEVDADTTAQYQEGTAVRPLSTVVSAINVSSYRTGTLLRVDRSPIYLVSNGTLVHIPNPQALRAYGNRRAIEISGSSLLP
ncbi:MAG: Ig-like domain-containing protein, partial [bacterium]|nr:Ig-like domain-containing protein [bacterium]